MLLLKRVFQWPMTALEVMRDLIHDATAPGDDELRRIARSVLGCVAAAVVMLVMLVRWIGKYL
jgi:hypothetical protein